MGIICESCGRDIDALGQDNMSCTCEPRETAAPTLGGAAQDAAMPCLKAEEARGFAMPDMNVEVTAEELAKSLREAMKPAMRMAVE